MRPKGEDAIVLGLIGRWDEMKVIVDVGRERHEKFAPPSQLLIVHGSRS